MSDNTVKELLHEISVEITMRVAQMLSDASRHMAPQKRDQIDFMIHNQLPDVVLNTIYQTPQLHTQKGVDHLKDNLDHYSSQIAQRFIKNDA